MLPSEVVGERVRVRGDPVLGLLLCPAHDPLALRVEKVGRLFDIAHPPLRRGRRDEVRAAARRRDVGQTARVLRVRHKLLKLRAGDASVGRRGGAVRVVGRTSRRGTCRGAEAAGAREGRISPSGGRARAERQPSSRRAAAEIAPSGGRDRAERRPRSRRAAAEIAHLVGAREELDQPRVVELQLVEERLDLRLGAAREVEVLELLLAAHQLPAEVAVGPFELADPRGAVLDSRGARLAELE